MLSLRCVIIDDEESAINILSDYVEKTPFLKKVFSSQNPVEGFMYLQQHKAEILFLDINMAEMTGIELARLLEGTSIKIIFTTAYSQYALDGFDLGATDYLLKPISFERFLKATKKILQQYTENQPVSETNTALITPANGYLLLKADRNMHIRLALQDICYIESRKNYADFHTHKETHSVLYTLKEIEEKLPVHQFARIHKSYIVAIDKISRLDQNFVYITIKSDAKEREKAISIGDNYKKSIMELLQNSGTLKRGD